MTRFLASADAAVTIRDAVNAHCRGDYDIIERETAIRALSEGRACILNTSGYHNQVASLGAEAVNEGESLVSFMQRQAEKFGLQSRYSNRSWWSTNVIDCLHPLNKAGAAEIEAARWWCAECAAAAE